VLVHKLVLDHISGVTKSMTVMIDQMKNIAVCYKSYILIQQGYCQTLIDSYSFRVWGTALGLNSKQLLAL